MAPILPFLLLTLPFTLAAHTGGACLRSKRTTCSTPSGSGTCGSTSSCAGFSVAGYCPGASDIQCCVSQSCSGSAGSGTCLDTSSGCDGGSFVSGLCPGDSSVQCCIKGSGGSSGGGGSSGSGGGTTPTADDPHPINAAALSMIESLEGFRANYYDIDGDKTIGYGHDCTQRGDCASITPPLTQAQGEALFKKDLVEYENCVCALPNAAQLNANQYGALTSFAYNAGCGGVSSSFKSRMASSDFSGICDALPSTRNNGGELTSRRKKEQALCRTATGDASGC